MTAVGDHFVVVHPAERKDAAAVTGRSIKRATGVR